MRNQQLRMASMQKIEEFKTRRLLQPPDETISRSPAKTKSSSSSSSAGMTPFAFLESRIESLKAGTSVNKSPNNSSKTAAAKSEQNSLKNVNTRTIVSPTSKGSPSQALNKSFSSIQSINALLVKSNNSASFSQKVAAKRLAIEEKINYSPSETIKKVEKVSSLPKTVNKEKLQPKEVIENAKKKLSRSSSAFFARNSQRRLKEEEEIDEDEDEDDLDDEHEAPFDRRKSFGSAISIPKLNLSFSGNQSSELKPKSITRTHNRSLSNAPSDFFLFGKKPNDFFEDDEDTFEVLEDVEQKPQTITSTPKKSEPLAFVSESFASQQQQREVPAVSPVKSSTPGDLPVSPGLKLSGLKIDTEAARSRNSQKSPKPNQTESDLKIDEFNKKVNEINEKYEQEISLMSEKQKQDQLEKDIQKEKEAKNKEAEYLSLVEYYRTEFEKMKSSYKDVQDLNASLKQRIEIFNIMIRGKDQDYQQEHSRLVSHYTSELNRKDDTISELNKGMFMKDKIVEEKTKKERENLIENMRLKKKLDEISNASQQFLNAELTAKLENENNKKLEEMKLRYELEISRRDLEAKQRHSALEKEISKYKLKNNELEKKLSSTTRSTLSSTPSSTTSSINLSPTNSSHEIFDSEF